MSVMANWAIEIKKYVNEGISDKNLVTALYHGMYGVISSVD